MDLVFNEEKFIVESPSASGNKTIEPTMALVQKTFNDKKKTGEIDSQVKGLSTPFLVQHFNFIQLYTKKDLEDFINSDGWEKLVVRYDDTPKVNKILKDIIRDVTFRVKKLKSIGELKETEKTCTVAIHFYVNASFRQEQISQFEIVYLLKLAGVKQAWMIAKTEPISFMNKMRFQTITYVKFDTVEQSLDFYNTYNFYTVNTLKCYVKLGELEEFKRDFKQLTPLNFNISLDNRTSIMIRDRVLRYNQSQETISKYHEMKINDIQRTGSVTVSEADDRIIFDYRDPESNKKGSISRADRLRFQNLNSDTGPNMAYKYSLNEAKYDRIEKSVTKAFERKVENESILNVNTVFNVHNIGLGFAEIFAKANQNKKNMVVEDKQNK